MDPVLGGISGSSNTMLKLLCTTSFIIYSWSTQNQRNLVYTARSETGQEYNVIFGKDIRLCVYSDKSFYKKLIRARSTLRP